MEEEDELLRDLLMDAVENQCGFAPSAEDISIFFKELTEKTPRQALASKTKESVSVVSQSRNAAQYFAKEKKTENVTGTKPFECEIFGKSFQVNNWLELYLTCLENIREKTGNDFAKIILVTGRSLPYFTTDRNTLRRAIKIGNTNLYTEGNLSAQNICNNLKKALSLFGYDPEILKYKFQ